jgi:hypothetical protein
MRALEVANHLNHHARGHREFEYAGGKPKIVPDHPETQTMGGLYRRPLSQKEQT